MSSRQPLPEINHHTMKLIVGLIALSLASLTSLFAHTKIDSISASYYEGGWSATIFIGFLFAIAAFLLAYNGYTTTQMVLSKVAGVSTLIVAVFPCACGGHDELIPNLHSISAIVTFGVLAFFCYVFFRRARDKGGMRANSRAVIYAACGIAIVLTIVTLAFDYLSHGVVSSALSTQRLMFYGERTALIAFGISWLTASHCLPLLADRADFLWRAEQPAQAIG